jgi:transglutaminase-like putative cysteine protease
MTDATYRGRVQADFRKKMSLVGMQFFKTDSPTQKGKISTVEKEALEFLYAYMPMADVTDYSTQFYLDNVRASLRTRDEMPWGKKVPELLFRHFVVPIRVNNENLDESRTAFYKELKQRVAGLSMKDAILEVNHWCHEKVTYEPSDARTTSPLASVRNAFGRCGEESTFTVAALRSVGIPARQVYTPRWAHTDDNHAWVEAWADGQWYFLGACEPEPVLNLGWFNAPASRAMLMHTRVFGHYEGPEEVMLETPNATEINLIGNYAATARTDIEVTDAAGKPVADARVDFKIYNYGEFCTVATKYTDATGRTFLTAGLGDMMAWASKEGRFGYEKVSFGKDKTITISLSRSKMSETEAAAGAVQNFDIVPPAEHAVMPPVTDAMRKTNDQRKAREDSIRNAYMSTFMNKQQAAAFAASIGMQDDSIEQMLVTSRGNHKVITDFLTAHKGTGAKRAVALLRCLSDKDLRDISPQVLEDNFNAEHAILNPRVENEMLYPYKNILLHGVSEEQANTYRQDPAALVKWCHDKLRIDPSQKFDTYAMSPVGVWKARTCNVRSRDIFFVAMARALGIDARKDPVTGKVQYRKGTENWTDVNFDATVQTTTPTGKLILTYQPTTMFPNPNYYTHFTITRVTDQGGTSLLTFDEGQVDMGGGVSWENTFKNGVQLDEGTYILVTGTRLANGKVLATGQLFRISAGKTTELPLVLRTSQSDVSVIGQFDSESKYLPAESVNGKLKAAAKTERKSILATTGRGYFVVGLINVGQEPSTHALRDIAAARQQLEKWGRPIVLLFPDEEQMNRFQTSAYGQLPSTVSFGIDTDGSVARQIAQNIKTPASTSCMTATGCSTCAAKASGNMVQETSSAPSIPLFIIADTFNRVVFFSQGYTIGLGQQILDTVNKL